jgi:hypothetical protein
MTYSIFYSDVKPPENVQIDISKLMPFICPTRENALETAFNLIKNGAIIWEIRESDSSKIARTEIEKLYLEYLKNSA